MEYIFLLVFSLFSIFFLSAFLSYTATDNAIYLAPFYLRDVLFSYPGFLGGYHDKLLVFPVVNVYDDDVSTFLSLESKDCRLSGSGGLFNRGM